MALSSCAAWESGGPGWQVAPDVQAWSTRPAGRPRLRRAASGVRWCSSIRSTHLPLSRKPPRTRANRLSEVPSFTETYEAQARQYVARIARQSGYRPAYGTREIAAAIEKDRFCREFCVREYKWSAHNLARFVNRTGEGPERIKEMKGIIAGLCGGLDGPRWCKTLS